MFGVLGILSALFQRQRTGQGRYLKSALFETTAFFMGQHMAYASTSETPVPPMPARVSAWSIYRIFHTAEDTPLFVGVISEKQWEAFCRSFERRDWLEDPRLATNHDRIDAAPWFIPQVEAMFAALPFEQAVARCERAGISFAPITRPEDLFEDPQLNQRTGGLLDTTLPNGIRTRLPRLPIEMEGADLGLRAHPPLVGQDTEAILREAGYDSDAISEMKRAEVIG